jgi:hypothetical protein
MINCIIYIIYLYSKFFHIGPKDTLLNINYKYFYVIYFIHRNIRYFYIPSMAILCINYIETLDKASILLYEKLYTRNKFYNLIKIYIIFVFLYKNFQIWRIQTSSHIICDDRILYEYINHFLYCFALSLMIQFENLSVSP